MQNWFVRNRNVWLFNCVLTNDSCLIELLVIHRNTWNSIKLSKFARMIFALIKHFELARIRIWNLLICSQTRYPLHHKQDDQLEHILSRYVALKTWQRRWTIGRSGMRGSGISVLAARHDDDDIYTCVCVCVCGHRSRK